VRVQVHQEEEVIFDKNLQTREEEKEGNRKRRQAN
jgi:hypothetical protein